MRGKIPVYLTLDTGSIQIQVVCLFESSPYQQPGRKKLERKYNTKLVEDIYVTMHKVLRKHFFHNCSYCIRKQVDAYF